MNHIPVISGAEMKRLETAAFNDGQSDEEYMNQAGEGIARELEKLLLTKEPIHILIGKGNNGGDGFVVGALMARRGYPVTAYHLYPIEECSPLSQKMAARFLKGGGQLMHLQNAPHFEEGVILDGLLGTGFKGTLEGFLEEVIEAVNQSGLPIYAIDIPSGVSGDLGKEEGVAIHALVTFYLGLPKIGFFLGKGWNHVGKLVGVDFGMPEKYTEEAQILAYLPCEQDFNKLLPKMERGRHKYEAGYVLAVAGSAAMPGAAMMAGLSALKMGAGIVRLFYPEGMEAELSTAPYELIKEPWNLRNDARILEEEKRAKALLIGPGMGRSEETRQAVTNLLAKTALPTVIDADALYFLAQNTEMTLPKEAILTPHHGEMEKILGEKPTLENCQRFVNEKGVILILKGAPSLIFASHTKPLIIPRGDPGMATAGTGDVLTGMLAALLAQGLNTQVAAALGVYLHALAGELASEEETSYSVIATDLIQFLPEALHFVQRLSST